MASPDFYQIGPAKLFMGDPTQALGAGLVDLGNVEEATLDYGIRTAFQSTADLSGAPLADASYNHAPNPTITARLSNSSIDILKALIYAGGSLVTGTAPNEKEAFGPGSTFRKVTLPSLIMLPLQQREDGIQASNLVSFPAVLTEGLSGLSLQRASEGEINNTYSVTFRAALREEDQASTALNELHRLIIVGPPEAAGVTWSMPAVV